MDDLPGMWETADLTGGQTDMSEDLDFCHALSHLKAGKQLSRRNWNAPGQFIFLMKGYPEGVNANRNTAKALDIAEGTVIFVQPYIAIKTVQETIVPWLPSQSDLLEEDWYVAQ